MADTMADTEIMAVDKFSYGAYAKGIPWRRRASHVVVLGTQSPSAAPQANFTGGITQEV